MLMICPICKIPFVTHKCNYGRSDILCPLGCRQKRKKENANGRSRKYYDSPKGKNKKKILNRARSDKTIIINKKDQYFHKKYNDPFIIYAKFILDSIVKIKLKLSEITDVVQIVRSHCLEFMKKMCDLSNPDEKFN